MVSFLPKVALLIIPCLILPSMPILAEDPSTSSYKILASSEDGLNLFTVKELIKKGDDSLSNDDLEIARENFDNARILTKQLLGFYRDLNGSFRGIDARIPREMDSKGREAQSLLAKINLRLASLFRRQNQAEVAVPLLIEVIRLMTPVKPEGLKAYKSLVELGFADTPYDVQRNGN